jgi:pimeloyl-ACP methyl ester carboxylesterase
MTAGNLAVFLNVALAMSGYRLPEQESAGPLSPSEAYKTALAPFIETRSQANDLTDADKFALRIGINRAAHDCLALVPNRSSLTGNAKELFALAQLCIFGQQYEPARATLVDYLALPEPAQREQALLLLVRAYAGLKEAAGAEAQVESLLRDYPYDAGIHNAIDQVIDISEGLNKNYLALKLCTIQNVETLPLLANGKALEAKDGSVPAAKLFGDAVRCAAIAQSESQLSRMDDLVAVARQPGWTGTADLAPMQAALERQLMVGKSVPLASLRGDLPGTASLVPRTVSLRQGKVLLVPFTLWSPSAPEIANDLAKLAPGQPIYAITSWHANTGSDDVRSNEVLEGLRTWQKGLPKAVSILIVPDSVLSAFHSDGFPGGIFIRDGVVMSNGALSSEGAERLLVNTLAEDVSAEQARKPDVAAPAATGTLLDVGGYRVHVDCRGSGSPAVMIVGAAFSFDWDLVQSAVAKFTRVCTFDPSGTAWSDSFESAARVLGPAAAPRSAPNCADRVAEIHRVITSAALENSYVLVGFSVGALWERLYAARYPEGIAGMVIVDHAFLPDDKASGAGAASVPASSGKDGGPVLIAQAPLVFGFEDDVNFSKLPERDQEMHKWALAQHPLRPGEAMAADCFTQIDRAVRNSAYPLGDMPLTVVRTENEAPGYAEMQAKLLGLSHQSRQVMAWNSSHMVPVDEPDVIALAIQAMVEAARNHR